MKKSNRIIFSLAILLAFMWVSCKVDRINGINEPVKDISGTWKIVTATRNGTDLFSLLDTNYYNLNKFRVIFNSGKYTLANPLPFIVSQNGSYSLDNPQYPFKITFTQTGSTTPVSTSFTYPISNGVRVLTLIFSPGCTQNTYSYTLEKIN